MFIRRPDVVGAWFRRADASRSVAVPPSPVSAASLGGASARPAPATRAVPAARSPRGGSVADCGTRRPRCAMHRRYPSATRGAPERARAVHLGARESSARSTVARYAWHSGLHAARRARCRRSRSHRARSPECAPRVRPRHRLAMTLSSHGSPGVRQGDPRSAFDIVAGEGRDAESGAEKIATYSEGAVFVNDSCR